MPPAAQSREEERRLNTRTLTIASVASASAAAVTSQLWIAGTWIAAALTPVLVALISEAMHRPTERIARAWTSPGAEARSSRAISPTRREPTAVSGTPGPVRVYRTGGDSGSRSTMLTRRRIALGTVAATAAIACVIGLVTLTTVDLVSGGSVGKGSARFTLGGATSKSGEQNQQKDSSSQPSGQQDSTGQQNDTQRNQATTTPTESTPEEQPPTSNTAPVPPPSEAPPGEPVPQTPSP